jgi:hypothetical protein
MFRAFQDMDLSLWQSAVAEMFREETEERRKEIDEATADYCEESFDAEGDISTNSLLDRLLEKPIAFTSAFYHRLAMAELFPNLGLGGQWMSRGRRFEEGKDRRWLDCVKTYRKYRSGQNRSQNYRSSFSGRQLKPNFSVIDKVLPGKGTIGIIGDWWNGEPAAINVLKGVISYKPDLIIHLGDIYYSGTKQECTDYFYDVIRNKVPYWGPVYTLAGNHDYYAAGTGFHWLIDELNKKWGPTQEASYFCLRNNDWQLIGMDTGYHDAVPILPTVARKMGAFWATSLRPDEIHWHLDKLLNAGKRKTILLSHHQLYSAYDQIGIPNGRDSSNSALWQTFAPFLAKDQICAWFWGHEHDYMTFDPFYQDLPLGICIGHGAIPVKTSKHPKNIRSPYDRLPPALTKHVLNSVGGYYNNGFSILRLDGPSAEIQHFEVDGSGNPNQIAADTIA